MVRYNFWCGLVTCLPFWQDLSIDINWLSKYSSQSICHASLSFRALQCLQQVLKAFDNLVFLCNQDWYNMSYTLEILLDPVSIICCFKSQSFCLAPQNIALILDLSHFTKARNHYIYNVLDIREQSNHLFAIALSPCANSVKRIWLFLSDWHS